MCGHSITPHFLRKTSGGNFNFMCMSTTRSPEHRRFALTSFVDIADELQHSKVNYYCYQQEVCPQTKKLHWQAYFETHKKHSKSAIIKFLEALLKCHDFHVEIAQASMDKNRHYCQKESGIEGTFVEWGEPMKQGKRNDLEDVCQQVVEGKSTKEIYVENPTAVKHYKLIHELRKTLLTDKTKLRKLEVYYIWSKTGGTGKSHKVFEMISGADYSCPMLSPPKIWFQDYEGQPVIWLDDVNLLEYPRSTILRMLDQFPMHVENKGGSFPACYTKVYITSNIDPDVIYQRDYCIWRRFTEIIHVPEIIFSQKIVQKNTLSM